MNREESRKLEGLLCKTDRTLLAMIAERAGLSYDSILAVYVKYPEYLRFRKRSEMRQWIKDFDAGDIVHDDELKEAENAN